MCEWRFQCFAVGGMWLPETRKGATLLLVGEPQSNEPRLFLATMGPTEGLSKWNATRENWVSVSHNTAIPGAGF